MKKLSDLMSSSIEQKEILRSARAQALFKEWPKVVGETLAAKTTPDRYEKGTLWICATSSTWAQELRMLEETVLQRMNNLSDDNHLFREIRVGIRPNHRDLLG